MREFTEDLRELKAWLRDHRKGALFVAAFSVLVFGIKLFYHDVGIDSESIFTDPNMYNRVWISTGRYGLVLTKLLFGFSHMIPYGANLLMLLTLNAVVTLFSFLVFKWSRGQVNSRFFYPVFGVMFLSSPILAEQFYFTLQSFEIAWAMLLCVAASYFAGKLAYGPRYRLRDESRQWLMAAARFGLPALLFMIWAFATYQAFTVIYIIIVLVSYLLTFQAEKSGKSSRSYFFGGLRQVILFLAGISGWWIIHKLLCRFFFGELQYTANMILWKVDPSSCLATIKGEFLQMCLGSSFYYQKLFLPVLILAALLMLIRALRSCRKQLPCFILALALYMISPLLLTLVTGGGYPMRSRMFYPLAMAFAFAFVAAVIRHRLIRLAFLLTVMVCAWQQTGYSLALQETAHIAYESDRNLMNRIVARMEEVAGKRLGDVPTVFVGKLAPDLPTDVLRGEVTGHSFFEWDAGYYATGNHRITGLAGVMGVELMSADDEQKKAAVEYSRAMNPWPAADSVRMKDGVLIVKLSSPDKTTNRWWYSGGWHYWMNNFTVNLVSDWKEIDGIWYYFDENGNMVTGEREIKGVLYRFDTDGMWIEE